MACQYGSCYSTLRTPLVQICLPQWGGEQATVYDDMHLGDYIAVVLNFVNKRTAHAAGGVCLLLSHISHSALSTLDT